MVTHTARTISICRCHVSHMVVETFKKALMCHENFEFTSDKQVFEVTKYYSVIISIYKIPCPITWGLEYPFHEP